MTDNTTPALPRRLYFGAQDKFYRSAFVPGLQDNIIGQRHKQAAILTQRAEEVAAAVKVLRAMDGTGNTEAALVHLQAAVADLDLAHRNLAENVAAACAAWRERHAGTPAEDHPADQEPADVPAPVPVPSDLAQAAAAARATFARNQRKAGRDA